MLGETVKKARTSYGLGLRELARRSRVSPAQVSRIESGSVAQPSADTLISISRALDRNPTPLLIVSGHITVGEARTILADMFRPHAGAEYDPATDSELVEDWTSMGLHREIAAARQLVAKESPSEDKLKALAAEVFMTTETAETMWRDSFIESLARNATDDELVALANIWQTLTPDRKTKVLDYATEQSELARIKRTTRR